MAQLIPAAEVVVGELTGELAHIVDCPCGEWAPTCSDGPARCQTLVLYRPAFDGDKVLRPCKHGAVRHQERDRFRRCSGVRCQVAKTLAG